MIYRIGRGSEVRIPGVRSLELRVPDTFQQKLIHVV